MSGDPAIDPGNSVANGSFVFWYAVCSKIPRFIHTSAMNPDSTLKKGENTMTIWKDFVKNDPSMSQTEMGRENPLPAETASAPSPTRKPAADPKESVIGAGLAIEGKIEGEGDIRIAGSFKGDVRVKGNLTVDSGAHISAEISADIVTVGGQVEGNINASTQVKLLESGQLVGDLKAKSLTVAAGSRMRGRVEFGWDEQETKKIELNVVKKVENRPAL